MVAETPILEMRGISKAFGGVRALKNVSFTCKPGKVHALLGENGAGKSTLIKILAGAYKADAGEIIYKGRTYKDFSTRQALDHGIRIIYQELNLVPDMNVAENIFLGNEPRRLGFINSRRLYRQANEVLQRLGVTLNLRTPIKELTVAQRQMVEIAKALSQAADLIVMDEPSAILAGHELEQLFQIIKSLISHGVTIVYISHRLDEIFEIADEVTVLKDGEVVATRDIKEVARPELIRMMIGRTLDEAFPPPVGDGIGEPVLVAENVTTHKLPYPFSLTLHAGEILGIAGMVGSGRSELAHALFGADPLKSGTIRLNGRRIRIRSPKQAVRTQLALVPEDRKTQGLFIEQSVRNNVTIAKLEDLTRYGVINRSHEAQVVNQAQRDLSINMASMNQEVQYLSGGNQQKVVLAKWLRMTPSIVILDEPTRGVDVGARFEIYQIMRKLTEKGVAILMISSELPEIIGMSDRILVMHEKKVVGELSGDNVTEEQILALATTGREYAEEA